MPYRYLEEIALADVAFEAWGESREEMFAAAALALVNVMVENPRELESREKVAIRLEHPELDLLLFDFLQELIFYKDARRLLLLVESLVIREEGELFTLEATFGGEEIDPARHHLAVDVKAVTLHRFRVVCAEGVWRATVVVDV